MPAARVRATRQTTLIKIIKPSSEGIARGPNAKELGHPEALNLTDSSFKRLDAGENNKKKEGEKISDSGEKGEPAGKVESMSSPRAKTFL